MAFDILIVDDEADIRELVAGILQDEGFVTRTARESDDALTQIEARRPNLVFLDIWPQGGRPDGLQLLDSIKQEHAELPVVMISGHGNIETAVAAIKQGAYDFIEKPFKADRLVLVAQRALENSRLKREVKALKQLSPSTLVGHSPSINLLRQTVEKVSPTPPPPPAPPPPPRRERARGARRACGLGPRRGSVCGDQCSGDDAGADGDRAVRGGGAERHAGAQDRRARGGRWRLAVHRRDR